MNKRLRVLVTALEEPWPLNSGFRLRLFHFIRVLNAHAAITLAVPRAPEYASALPSAVKMVGMQDAAAAPPAWALPQTMLWRRAREHYGHNTRIDAWLAAHARPERFDVALLAGPAMGLHAPALRIPLVWDVVDEQALSVLRMAQFGSWRRWPRAAWDIAFSALFERMVGSRTRRVVVASRVDADFARRWIAPRKVVSITNGVDLNYFAPALEGGERGVLTFVGALDFAPNTDGITHFVHAIWPAVRAAGVAHTLQIVGRRPTAPIRGLAAAPGVTLATDVPDVRGYVRRGAVVIVPTRMGGGVKNKVLEACAMRRPVVVTRRALGDLTARVGRDVFVADTAAEWVKRLRCLHARHTRAARLAENGYRWVRGAHDWDKLGTRLAGVLRSAAAQQSAGMPAAVRSEAGSAVREAGELVTCP